MKQRILTWSRKAVALLALTALAVAIPARVYANPEGGVVAAGQATITVRPNVVDVHQQSNKAVIDWRSFDIGEGETTEFHQPNTAAIALNRVHSGQASVINGALKANGNVIVVNQNGVLFGRNARVDVNGLVATTADIDNDKFMNQSKLDFDKPGNPNAAIVNQGQITAKESGLVGFVAPHVENDGIIAARLGRVQLAAGDKATVDFYGDGLMEVAVSDDVRQQLVKNTGTLSADGGTVALTAAAGNRILASALEVGGSISTQTVAQRNGRIVISGLGGNAVAGNVASAKTGQTISTARVTGTLNASGTGSGQKGGSITVTADSVQLASSAKLNASGHSGGGAIKVGGDFYGQGSTPTAERLVVDAGASILNDALYTGHGGTTALWSDGATNFAGAISNRGGQFGGNGGFVEVSGKEMLGYHGMVDTRAPMGMVGTLLLDPANITISNLANSNVSGATPFGSTGAATSNLNVGTLVAALGSSNVTINTAAGSGGQGDITFTNAVSWNSGFSLTATANRHITVNAAITNAGAGDITLNANAAGSNITVAAPISTGGSIFLNAAQDILLNAGLTSGGGMAFTSTNRDIISNASGTMNAGNIITLSGRDIVLANSSAAGSFTAVATRNLTTLAGTTITNGPTSTMTLHAANGVVTGTGNLTLNGVLNTGTGQLNLVSGVNGTRPSWTITAANLIEQSTLGQLTINGFLDTVIDRDLHSTGSIAITSFRDLTLNAGRTISLTGGSTFALRAANNAVGGTGALYLNGNILMGTGAMTLLSGDNGGRPNYTLTGTNFTRQGVAWGTISLLGFNDIIIDTDLNANGNITMTSYRDITVNAGRTLTSGASSGISLTAANNAVGGVGNLNLNGTLVNGTAALSLTTGANGTRPSITLDGVGIQRQGAAYGGFSIVGFLDIIVNDDIVSSGNVTLTAFNDLVVNAGKTITTGTNSGLGLRAANGNAGGTGHLIMNGMVNVGTGTFTMISGLQGGVRQNFTLTETNMAPIGAAVGATTITGFQDFVVDRDLISTGNLSINSFQDLTIATGRTVSSGATGSLTLTAANNSNTGTGNLYLNGVIGAGSGGLVLSTGINGTRLDWTATETNLLQQGANFGVVSISGFQDLTIDRDIIGGGGTTTTGVTMLAYRDLTINAGRTVTTAAAGTGALSLRAAGGVALDTGRLTINGNIGSGTGSLTLLSGINGTRPSFTATATTLQQMGATFGPTSIVGFADFVVDRVINAAGAVTIGSNGNQITLNNDIAASGSGTITLAAPVVIAEGANVTLSTNNRNIAINGGSIDDTVGGGIETLTVNSGAANTTISGAVNGIGLTVSGASLSLPTSLGATRALKDVSLTASNPVTAPTITANKILIRTTGATSNLTLAAGRTLTASDPGDAIVLVAGQNFINNGGVGALVRPGGGRYLIYSTAPGSDTVNGLTYDERRFSCGFASAGTCAFNATINSTVSVPTTGNVFLYSSTPLLLVVNLAQIDDIVYGAPVPNLTNLAYEPFTQSSGYVTAEDFANDVISGTINGQTNYVQGANVGSYSISYLNGSLTSALGYGFDYQTLPNAFDVTPRTVSVDLSGTASKVYNGTNIATLLGANYTINNIYSGDTLTLGVANTSVTYDNKNVGSNKTVTANGLSLTGAPAGNYILSNTSAVAGVGTITPRALTVTGVAPNKVYDATTASSATLSDNRVGGDVLTVGYGTASFANKNVGTGKTVTISGITLGGTDAGNYTFNTSATTTANITPAALTVSAIGINKVYDATTAATVTLGDNRLGGDVLVLGYGAASFANKNVANGKTVSVSGITLGGADAGNYTFNTTASTTANITPAALTVSATGINKVYDATTGATVMLGDNRFGGDVLTLGYGTASFANKNVANGKTVSVSGITLGGPDAGNYTFNTTASTTANITPATLTISANGINRVYDATTNATVTLGDNRLGSDVLVLSYGAASFANKNVANGKTVSVSGITLGGADAGNYTFNTTASTTANITPATLVISAAGINRVYDATTNATVTLGDNRFGGDVLTLGYGTASFADKNVANGKTVSVSGITLGGADAGNYTFNTTASTTANITPATLTISATGINRVYDATTNATVTLGDDRLGSDVLVLGYGAASFANKNVANGKMVNVSGITLGGADAGNYTFNATASTTANITPATLTISANGINRVYDATTGATVTLGDNRFGGDVLTLGYGSASFADKNVANGKTVSVSGITLGGADAGNYTFNTSASTTADITPATLTISATGINRVYDATTNATVNLGDDRLGGDVLVLGYGSASFADKNVANGKTVSVSGITLGGADAGNYTFNTTANTTANITPATLTISANGINRVYDATTNATVTLGDDRFGGDVLTLGYGAASFADKNVANGKTVNVSGITLGGADADNYTFNTSASTTADITPATLTISANGINKVYDATTNATVTLGDDRFGGDVLVLAYGAASFVDKNVANGKTVNVSGITLGGADAGNYTFNSTASTTANITPATLTISATGVNRVYDATTNATVTLGDDRFGGDALTIGYGSASFADKNVANGKTVNVSGITLGGADAGNYTFNTTANTTANITPATLVISATGINRVYDGTTNATVTLGDNSFGGDVLTLGYGAASFADKNVANGKTVSVSGITLGGADAGNYTFNTTASTTANITPATLVISATGINKVYDGNDLASVTLSDNRFGGDVLSIAFGSALFTDKNAGAGRIVTVSGITVVGADAGNYTFNASATTNADITPRALTISASGINKVYDGTNIATVTLGDDRLGGDVLILTYGSALFPDKNVGNGRTVNVSGISLAGADAANYSYNTSATTSANITPALLTVGASGVNRTYDGTANTVVTLNDNRVGGDSLTMTYGSASFADKHVGNGKTVSVSGINVTGTDAGNYTFNTTTSTTADITPYALVISASGISKVYDGTADATVTISDNRIGGDSLSITFASALFPDQNAGNGRVVTVSGIGLSGADAGNYTFNNSATTTADITRAVLTVTAANQNIQYGTVVPGTTLAYNGFVGGEGVANLMSAPTVSSLQSGIVNAGTYTNNYTVGGGADGNYSFVYVPGTLTVGKKTLNVTANTQTVTYGTVVPSGTLSFSGFIAGQDATFLDVMPVVNSAQSGIVNAGTYANNYTASGGSSANYDFAYVAGNLVVNKKELNVTADNISITYGATVPTGTLVYNGFIGGEGAGDLDVLPTLVSAASGVVDAGTYTNNYTVSGGADGNYTFQYAPGTLTVTPAGLNVTVNNQTITYGSVVPGTTINYSGFVNGDTVLDLAVLPSIVSAQSGVVNAGTYTGNYTASGAASNNYTFNYIAGNLVVGKKALNVTAENRTVTYGTAVPTSALNYSGFIAGEDASFLTSAPTLTSLLSGVVNAGTYNGNYTISGGVADNYYFNFTPGNLVVGARTLTVSALPQSVVYGTAVPTSGISYVGFASGEDASFLSVAPVVSSAQSGVVNAGTYVNNYTVSGGSSNNYAFVYVPANLVVTKKTLNVTANGRTITYGTAVPGTTLTYSGFVGGQDATFLDVAPVVNSAQSGIVNAGTYAANYVASGGVDTNYDFSYSAGTLTVDRAAVTISPNNVNRVYGNGTSFNGYSIAGLQLGETIGSVVIATNATTSASGQWNAGNWTLSASSASGGTFNPANYTISYLGGSMSITPRVLTIAPIAADRVYDGTDLASVTLSDNRIAGDAISTSFADARFPDKQAGLNRLVTVTGIALAGADAGNYTVASTATTTAAITRRVLVVSATAQDKQFDGTASATVSLSDDRLLGDVLTVTYSTAEFPDASAGDNRVVTITGLMLVGADGANYSVAPTALATASIIAVVGPPVDVPAIQPPTVIKVSQDTGSVMTSTTDDGIFATPSGGYQLIYLPYDAPDENRWRNKPLRVGVGGVPIIEPTAWYGTMKGDGESGDDDHKVSI